MSHQFKPGDLALVIGSSLGVSPNIGMSVELVQKIEDGGMFTIPDGRRVINRGPACWVVHGSGAIAQLKAGDLIDLGGFALCKEMYLMPLGGDFAPDQQKAKEEEPCL